MWIILVYRPEADSGEGNAFDGIELLGFSDTEQGADEMVTENLREHPDWEFSIEVAFNG